MEEKLPDLEDIYLKAILRCCKCDIGKCQLKLTKFWNVRRLISKNLKKIDAEKLEHLIEDGFTQCLPWSDKYGRPIYVFRPKMNLDNYNFEEMATYAAACIFSILEYPLPTINGIVVLVDCSLKNPLMLLKMACIAKKYFSLENSMPLRISRVDLINTNIIIQYCFAIVRPVLSSKIISRVGFYGSDLSQLHKIYHPDILPDDFGGTLGPLDTKLFKEEKLKIINKIKSESI